MDESQQGKRSPRPSDTSGPEDAATSSQTFPIIDAFDTKNKETRQFIRKHAMRNTAETRKQSGTWGKHNLRQDTVVRVGFPSETGESSSSIPYPQLGSAPATSSSAFSGSDIPNEFQSQGTTTQRFEQAPTSTPHVPPSPSSTGYELLRIEYDLDFLSLSALTSLHTGRHTAQVLHSAPESLSEVLKCTQWSYFSYLPFRFGYNLCLDDASRCLASRVTGWLRNGAVAPDQTTISLHNKALQSLQTAIEDPVECLQPEVLCAIQMLAMHELLIDPASHSWRQHASGSTSMIKHRGPGRYTTEFEKASFVAQIGPIFTEGILGNKTCFLSEDSWLAVIHAAMSDSDTPALSDRSPIVLSLWTHAVHIPNLFHTVQSLICTTPGGIPLDALTIQTLHHQINTLQQNLHAWLNHFSTLTSPSIHTPNDKTHETHAIGLISVILLNRLSVALSPLAPLAANLETESQVLVDRIMDMHARANVTSPRAALFMAFKKQAVEAVRITAGEWRFEGGDGGRVALNGAVEKAVFERYCMLKGRAV